VRVQLNIQPDLAYNGVAVDDILEWRFEHKMRIYEDIILVIGWTGNDRNRESSIYNWKLISRLKAALNVQNTRSHAAYYHNKHPLGK